MDLEKPLTFCKDLELGDTVVDIYEFMKFYLNPYHHKSKVFFHTVKGIKGDRFSVYTDNFDRSSESDAYLYTNFNLERSIQQIIDKIDDSYNRGAVFLSIKSDREIINFFIEYLFDQELNNVIDAELSMIEKYEQDIIILQRKIEVIKVFGMIEETNKKIYDREFIKSQRKNIDKRIKDGI